MVFRCRDCRYLCFLDDANMGKRLHVDPSWSTFPSHLGMQSGKSKKITFKWEYHGDIYYVNPLYSLHFLFWYCIRTTKPTKPVELYINLNVSEFSLGFILTVALCSQDFTTKLIALEHMYVHTHHKADGFLLKTKYSYVNPSKIFKSLCLIIVFPYFPHDIRHLFF